MELFYSQYQPETGAGLALYSVGDGADCPDSPATEWRRICLKNHLRPHMAVALLFRAIDAFKIFDIIYIMTRGGPGRVTETVSVYAYRLTFRFWHLGYGASVVLLIFLISLIGSMLLYRTLQRESL